MYSIHVYTFNLLFLFVFLLKLWHEGAFFSRHKAGKEGGFYFWQHNLDVKSMSGSFSASVFHPPPLVSSLCALTSCCLLDRAWDYCVNFSAVATHDAVCVCIYRKQLQWEILNGDQVSNADWTLKRITAESAVAVNVVVNCSLEASRF